MNILAIETSCDETGVSLVQCSRKNKKFSFEVRGNALLSQVQAHAEYGGVFPSVAKREHAKALIPLIEDVLRQAGTVEQTPVHTKTIEQAKTWLEREPHIQENIEKLASFDVSNIDAIAITVGPGLAPALWVGVNTARALAVLWDKPVIPVNHMHGHLFSPLYPEGTLYDTPALALLVSGGHTELLMLSEDFSIEMLGATRDDAIGEAFDKAARILDLGYPGGPAISALAQTARDNGTQSDISLPRPMLDDDTLDVSYSGLKTALLYHVRDNPIKDERERAALAREFEDAALDVIIVKTRRALEEHSSASLVVGGGVIANNELRRRLEGLAQNFGIPLNLPTTEVTTDNALMIAVAGYISTQLFKHPQDTPLSRIEAQANLSSVVFPA